MSYLGTKPTKLSVLLFLSLFGLLLSGCQSSGGAAPPSPFPMRHGNIRWKTFSPMKGTAPSLMIPCTAASAIPIPKHGRSGREPLNICIIRRNASCVSPGPARPRKNRSFTTCTILLRNLSIPGQAERTRHPIPAMYGIGMKETLS